MRINYKKIIKSSSKSSVYFGGGSGSSGNSSSGGIPYVYTEQGDYLIAKSLHSNGDIIAYSDGGIIDEESKLYLNDIADVDTATKQHGYVLTYDAPTNSYIFKQPATPGLSSVDWSDIQGKPATYTPSAHTHVIADISDNYDCGDY